MSGRTLTERAKMDWNRLAPDYESFRAKAGTFNEIVEIPAMLCLIGDVQDKTVLDAGCGYGFYAILLAKNGATVTGIDISENMIELAKKNAEKVSVKYQFFVCDMQDLSMFSSNTFDLVTSSIVVNYIDDLGKAFSEVFRVLKQNGVFTFSENHPMLKGWWERGQGGRRLHWNIDNYFHRHIEVVKWETQSGRVIETTSRHRTVKDYFDALVASGFSVERLIEPEPIEEGKSLNKERYNRAKRIPYFILFKARKP
ncbi:class I SAM-dependent methyltransferase [Thermoproteota archaeon]